MASMVIPDGRADQIYRIGPEDLVAATPTIVAGPVSGYAKEVRKYSHRVRTGSRWSGSRVPESIGPKRSKEARSRHRFRFPVPSTRSFFPPIRRSRHGNAISGRYPPMAKWSFSFPAEIHRKLRMSCPAASRNRISSGW